MTDTRISSLLAEAIVARAEGCDCPGDIVDVFDKVRAAKTAFDAAILELKTGLAMSEEEMRTTKDHHVGVESETWADALRWALEVFQKAGAA